MSNQRVRSLTALAAVALACAHARGGGDSGAIALRFVWPEPFQANVVVAHESRRSGAEPTVLLARERLVTERRGDELWVFTRDLAARGNDPDLDTTVKINEALVQVVAKDGRFRRAEGLDEALAAAKTASAGDRESTRRALQRSTAFDWEVLVGAWAGERLEPGALRRKQVSAYVPELPAVEALLDVEYGVEARVPCTGEDTARRCVALVYRGRLADGDRAATLARLRRVAASETNKAVPEDVHAEFEVLLVTEPGTLVPHRMSQRERLRVRLATPDGHVLETETRSEDTYGFSQGEPPPTSVPRRDEPRDPRREPEEPGRAPTDV
ncbi:MAG: hypothetical protein ACJ79E_21245 [Anaeromyxobacteraceae bacterium]